MPSSTLDLYCFTVLYIICRYKYKFYVRRMEKRKVFVSKTPSISLLFCFHVVTLGNNTKLSITVIMTTDSFVCIYSFLLSCSHPSLEILFCI